MRDFSEEQRRLYEAAFRKVVEPLYGDQAGSIEKMRRGEDREAYVLLVGGEITGTLVYKKALQSEYGLAQAFEIKTLCLFDAEHNSGRGYATHLLEMAENAAEQAGAASLFVTVAEDKPEVVSFFKRHGFYCVRVLPNAYRQGVSELVYAKDRERV